MQMLSPFVLRKKGLLLRAGALSLSVICVVVLLAQTVFARNTYVITDGEDVTVHTSFATDPETVLDEAGFELDADDFYTTQNGDGVSEITVQRGQLVTIDHCGEAFETCSYDETVGHLLDRLGVQSTGEYQASEARDTQITEGMVITVERVQSLLQTHSEEIPFGVTYCSDPKLPAGEEVVISEGVNGRKLVDTQLTFVNGEATGSTVLGETVIEEPVDQLIAVGTGEDVGGDLPAIGDGVIVLPTGEVLNYTHTGQFVATAYTNTDPGCGPITAKGTQCRVGAIAVDPTVIPYGTRMFVVTNDGKYIYGVCTAEDCGGAIKGNRLDLYFDTDPECWTFGVRDATVYFLGSASVR